MFGSLFFLLHPINFAVRPIDFRTTTRRATALLAMGAAVCLLAACGGQEDGPRPFSLTLEPVESPAGEGSGEPFLAVSGERVLLSWLEEAGEGQHALKLASLGSDGWSTPGTLATREDFFVNWADFPSVAEVAPGVLAAHWLQRGGLGTYD
jgi:hypothetical protein